MLFASATEAPQACFYLGPVENACLIIGMSGLSPQKPGVATA